MNIKSDLKLLSILFLITLITRLIYFWEYSGLAEFLSPTVDALYHHLSAKAISDGVIVSSEPFFRAPLYSYFLAIIYFFSDASIAVARFIQLLLGCFTPLLTYLIAKELFNKNVAILSALMAIFCGTILYFDAELLLESTAILLSMTAIWLMLKSLKVNNIILLIIAGLLAGSAVITRPNLILLLFVGIYLIYQTRNQLQNKAIYKSLLLFVLPALLPILIVLAHNITREDGAFTIATQGGINFYIGNNLQADGVSAVMPGELGFDWQYVDIKYLAEKEIGHKLTSSEINNFYYQKGLNDIYSDPLNFVKLLFKKWYLFFSGNEISNNRDLLLFQSQFSILKFLPIGIWLFGPLAIMGMLLAYRRSMAVRSLIWLIVLYSFSFAIFFVNSRFRIPILPLLIIFTSFTLISLYKIGKQAKKGDVIFIGVFAVLLIFIFNINFYKLQSSNLQHYLYNQGNLALMQNRNSNAIDYYYQALETEQLMRKLNLNLGIAFLRNNTPDSAEKYFLSEKKHFPSSAEAANNLSYLYRQRKEFQLAIEFARSALEYKPYLEEARLNLWHGLREAGDRDGCFSEITNYMKSNDLTLREQFLYAVSAIDLGEYTIAVSELSTLIKNLSESQHPDYSELSGRQFSVLQQPDNKFIARVYFNLGTAYGMSAQLSNSIMNLNKALEQDSSLVEAWINLGTAYLSVKETTKAQEVINIAIRRSGGTAMLYYQLSLCHVADNNKNAALQALSMSLQLNPDFPPAIELSNKLQ